MFGDNRVRVWAPPSSYTVWVPTDYVLPNPGPMPAPDAFTYPTLHFGNLQWPGAPTVDAGEAVTFYARAYAHGRTNAPGAATGLRAWVEAAYHGDQGHLDEFKATLAPPPGTYRVASRFSLDGGAYRYGGFGEPGGGFWDGERFASATLTVTAPPTYEIAGAVTTSGGPLGGVLLTLTGRPSPLVETTGPDGTLAFAELPAGAYTLTPALAGYGFTPANRAVAVDGEDISDLTFVGELLPVQLGPVEVSTPDPVAVGSSLTFEAA